MFLTGGEYYEESDKGSSIDTGHGDGGIHTDSMRRRKRRSTGCGEYGSSRR